MKNSRRKFLKFTGLTGLSVTGFGVLKSFAAGKRKKRANGFENNIYTEEQQFNMCGYAAPKLDPVRIGIIGLGDRGPEHLRILSKIEGVEIKALCDIRPEKVNQAKKLIEGTEHNPSLYSGKAEAWKKMCDRDDIDVVYIATPWDMHTPMSVYAMKHDKHACVEVPAAVTIEECWQLVETSERTRKHCRMLENACYGSLLTLHMARQGFFGEIVHGQGGYLHNLVPQYFFNKDQYWEMWRLRQNARRNGDLYPTHGLGPICQIMDINRGNALDYMVSMSGNDFTLAAKAKELAATDSFFEPYAHGHFRGNMNTTVIRTVKGQTITLDHDTSSPNIHSGMEKIVGTKGTSIQSRLLNKISNGGEDWLTEQETKTLEDEYQPELLRKVGEMAKQVGGHGGIDTIQNWFVVDSLRNGLPFDQDVYDAALWSAIGPLSEQSVACQSGAVKIPDFTRGAWKENKPFDISLQKGGNTKIVVG